MREFWDIAAAEVADASVAGREALAQNDLAWAKMAPIAIRAY